MYGTEVWSLYVLIDTSVPSQRGLEVACYADCEVMVSSITILPQADTYGLTRDAKESTRLDSQHIVWKKNTGFLLHPVIAASISDDAHICDLGTGTGTWILDLASEHGDSLRS
jgi:methylase of polypeptide subunit release factors